MPAEKGNHESKCETPDRFYGSSAPVKQANRPQRHFSSKRRRGSRLSVRLPGPSAKRSEWRGVDSEFTREGEFLPCHEGEHLDHCTKGNDTRKAGDAPALGTPPTGTDPAMPKATEGD